MQKNQSSAKTGMIVGNIFSALLILPALGALMILPMAFDAPGSEKVLINQIFVNFVIYFPVVCILSIPLSWWQFKRSNTEMAQLISISPIIIIIAFICIAYVFGNA